MNLLTKEILKKLPKLYANLGKHPADVEVVVKYFNPYGSGTWYITEGEVIEQSLTDGSPDMTLFGLCVIHSAELGYVKLSELAGLKKFGRPQIERDLHFRGTLASAMAREGV